MQIEVDGHLVQDLTPRVLIAVFRGPQVVAQVADTWACSSQAEGRWCNTKITVLYFVLPVYPEFRILPENIALAPVKRY